MIKRGRLQQIWRRTMVIFTVVQVVGICVFIFDLTESLRGTVDTSASTLTVAYAAFLLFSGVVFWMVFLIRRFVEQRYAEED